ncbi:response regulator [Trichocoleus sp. FACHB-90]|uniref:response regulator n=1 Tax=Cyanophyceae TaxID=3028117 RepID=UPI001685C1AE|nr:response regulator [Trichocoleus sp. FACHB-90]MBD1836203.1 response regulator [Cyanobacteria bacterium FACHB-472]MBD1924734.1 response regulator [Trichocoleus sp. FACHB-90]
MQTLPVYSGLTKLERQIVAINQKQATGELIVGYKTPQWRLCFFLGQLVYAVGETHRVRRWQRALKHHCPDWKVENDQLAITQLWECQLLHQGMAQGHLSAAQVKAVMCESTQEVLFSMIRQPSLSGCWRDREYQEPRLPFYLTLCFLEIQHLIQQSQHLYQQWQGLGVSYLDPEMAPVLKQSPSDVTQCSVDTFLNLTALFNGRYTIWDLALKMKQPLTRVARLLHHFYQQGVVELQTVPDFPPPLAPSYLIDGIRKSESTIACVDDSPMVGEYLKEILVPAGYRVVYIQDPIQGVAALAKHKPDLIFLDLVMPKTDGYNVCSFLRNSSAFRQTPVVILTSCDGLINRVRSKFVGANDFLTKPFESKQVLQVLKKHLPKKSAES